MTLPAQLREIADRLEAADAARAAALDELWQIRTVDSASVQVADEEHQPGDEQPSPSASAPAAPGAGDKPRKRGPAASPAPIQQTTSGERGKKGVLPGGPATIPASPGTEPGQVPSEQPPAATGGKPVPAFDPLGSRPSARSLLSKRDRKALSPAVPGQKRTCPKCERDWPPQGFMTHVRWCAGTKAARA